MHFEQDKLFSLLEGKLLKLLYVQYAKQPYMVSVRKKN